MKPNNLISDVRIRWVSLDLLRCYSSKKPPKSPLSEGLLETICYENHPNRNGIMKVDRHIGEDLTYRPAFALRKVA